MKKIRPVCLSLLAVSVLLVLATGCFRPAAPDVTPTTSGGAEAATPEESELEGTAIANTTRAAQTAEAQTAEAEAPGEEEPAETTAAPTATATTAPPTPTPTTCPPTPAPTAGPTETPMPAGEVTHVVQPGENLFRIALRYNTTVEAIAQENGIANARQIYVGQELTIPAGSAPAQPSQPAQPSPGGTTYVVQPGDNLFRIALRYNMSHLRLAEYNGIANPSNIYVGQVIRIPPQ